MTIRFARDVFPRGMACFISGYILAQLASIWV